MFSGIIQTTGRIVAIEPTPTGVRVRIDPADGPGDWDAPPKPGGSVCVSGCCLTQVGRVGADGILTFDVMPETLAKTTLGKLSPGDRVNLEPSVSASTPMDGHMVQGHVEGLGEVVKVVGGLGVEGECRVRIAPPVGLMPCMVPKGSVTVDGVSLTIAAVGTGRPQPEGRASSEVEISSTGVGGAQPSTASGPGGAQPSTASGAGAFQPPVGDAAGDRARSRAGKPAPLGSESSPPSEPLPPTVDPDQWFEVALIPTTLELTTMGSLKVGSKVNLETDILARTVVHVMQHYAGLMGRG